MNANHYYRVASRAKKEPFGNDFISTWKTDNTSADSSASNQIRLPLVGSGTYNFTVNWGDGSSNFITSWDQPEVTHTYANSGTYTITIVGVCVGWSFLASGDRLKILDISQWGDLKITTNTVINFGPFTNCANLNVTATDVPDFSLCSALVGFFQGCTSLSGTVEFNNWDVSTITNFRQFFQSCTNFNRNIGDWDVSNATEFRAMFRLSGFNNGGNPSINNWNMTSAINISSLNLGMFASCPFNQPIGNWSFPLVTSLADMFRGSPAFNQNVGSWNVSNVTNMSRMFESNNCAFNQNIGSWNVSNVTNMQNMFLGNNTAFDQNIGGWNVSKVSNFSGFMNGKSDTTLSASNLDAIYNVWSALTFVNTGLSISFGNAKYTSAGQSGRDVLTNAPNNWTITDGGI